MTQDNKNRTKAPSRSDAVNNGPGSGADGGGEAIALVSRDSGTDPGSTGTVASMTPVIAVPPTRSAAQAEESASGTAAVGMASAPTSAVPTADVPTSAVPTADVPTSAVPTADVPTSAVPTADVPTSAVPTSAMPTGALPTTVPARPDLGGEPVYAAMAGWQPAGSGAASNPDSAQSATVAAAQSPAGGTGSGAAAVTAGRTGSDQLRSPRRARDDGPEPAAALTADRLLRRSAAAPAGGWRLWLHRISLGSINVGDSDKIRLQRAREHRIAARLGQRTRYVPVLSRKGGVGKTTVTTLLGMALADLREDRVIAMDANPDRGTLSDRSPGRTDFTARQLVRDRFGVNSFSQLSTYVARDGSRLDVLASDTDPAVAQAFDDADYRAVTDILSRYYSIVLTDSGTGMVHSVMKGTLEKADAVVLVSGGSVDEARLASETLSWLEAHGRHDLVAKAIVVINMSSGDRTEVNINEIEDHFRSRVHHVLRIPYDRHLAEGSRVQLSALRPATRAAAVELAALVVDELQAG